MKRVKNLTAERAAKHRLARAIGRLIRKRREELRLSRREVAERLRIHLMTQLARESGKCMVPTDKLGDYAAVLGISAVELLACATAEHGGRDSITVLETP